MNGPFLPAHFDGEKITLDTPYALDVNTRLLVAVVPQAEAERDDWLHLSLMRFADAYGEDEPEYSLDAVKVLNPEYEGNARNGE